MRYLIILVGFSILCGCSKKTLSGVYIKKSDSLYDSYDFRTDGTVQDKYKQYFSTINDTINISRTGSYVLDGDKVVVDVIETTMDNDTVKYRDIFSEPADEPDLLHG